MFRPKNWKEFKDAIHEKINIGDPYYESEVDEGIEAGADAMLEGLRKDLLEQWGIVITDEGKIFIPIKGNDV